MQCPICNGSGVAQTPKKPSGSTFVISTDSECGACKGKGHLEGKPGNGAEFLGQIMAYDAQAKTVSFRLENSLRSGDRIVVKMGTNELELEVDIIQWGLAWVNMARRGWVITIPSPIHLGAGAKVYRVA